MGNLFKAGTLSVALLLGGLAACSGDSGTNPDEEVFQLFVGTWDASTFELREIGGDQDDAFDLIRFGMVLTLEVREDATFVIRQQFPGGDPQEDRGILEVFPDDGLVTLGFDQNSSSGPIQASYAFDDGTLTLNLPDAAFDFDDDGEDEAARVRLVLLKR